MLFQGEVVQMGTYTDLLVSSSSFANLLDAVHQIEQQDSIEFHRQQSIISSTYSDTDDETVALSKNVETKQKGMVKWHVYHAYLKAGIGIILGLFIVLILSSVREAASIFSNWWLAEWSDDESYRYRASYSCTNIHNNNTIWSMSQTEWDNHRNRRFYIYLGLYSRNDYIFRYFKFLFFLVLVLILLLMTLFHAIATEFMFLNAGRVLHNK